MIRGTWIITHTQLDKYPSSPTYPPRYNNNNVSYHIQVKYGKIKRKRNKNVKKKKVSIETFFWTSLDYITSMYRYNSFQSSWRPKKKENGMRIVQFI